MTVRSAVMKSSDSATIQKHFGQTTRRSFSHGAASEPVWLRHLARPVPGEVAQWAAGILGRAFADIPAGVSVEAIACVAAPGHRGCPVGSAVMLLGSDAASRGAGVRNRAGNELAKIPLFQNLSAKQLAAVDRLVTTIDVPAGRELIREGEPGQEFIVVVDGEAEVRRAAEVIAVRGPGTFVGEMALLLDRPRNASVVARTAMTIDVIDRQAFRQLLDEFPDLHAPLLAATAERLAELDESA
jgi:Cyclic nucleotide-binding domain